MAPDVAIATLLSDKIVQQVFKEILKNRTALFKEIRESVSATSGVEYSSQLSKIEEAVQSLKDADLIKERESPIEDFTTYYVTADGLSAEKQLHLSEPTSSTTI